MCLVMPTRFILRESMIRPQAAKGGDYPLWLFRQGVDRKLQQSHRHQGAGRMRQKEQSNGVRDRAAGERPRALGAGFGRRAVP